MGLWVILSDLIDRIRKKRQFYDQTRLKSKYGEVLRLQLIRSVGWVTSFCCPPSFLI